ncbi:BPSS1780 family membrane protein [Ramlibacter solisilvae]|uniref:Membrane protein n=1 Tax=Ramlibacter tataouinensis TaxID=94132 RepID=A0A127K0P8_9BURK|nr:BPSS1780 family membrane protein [Ramlibacter tataouinensis]AMO24432.1 membrane protein [Ramlibacter tataouinensis]
MKLNIVPARTGALWVRLGLQTFLRQPLAMSGLFFMYMVAVTLAEQIPVAGPFIARMLVPAATLGMMAASAEAAKGRFPMPSVLLSAFRAGRERASAMVILGAIFAAGSLAAWGLASLLAGARPAAGAAGEFDPLIMLGAGLHMPLSLIFWHAPALVHWHGLAPGKSLFFSLVACLRNFPALLVFMLTWLTLLSAIALLFILVGVMIGGEAGAQAVVMPLMLITAAMFTTSLYFTFRDSFLADGDPA